MYEQGKEVELQLKTCVPSGPNTLGYRGKGALDTHLPFSQIIEEEHESESNL